MDHQYLVHEAKKIIKDLDLVKTLTQYGDARVVGSVALEMVVKHGIDLHVLVESEALEDAAEKISKTLKQKSGLDQIDTYYDRIKNGVKLTIKDYPGESGNWIIEIWLFDWIGNTQFAFTELLQRTLTPEQRETIMKIKEDFYYQGFLKDEFRTLIYRAVLEDGVRNSDEMLVWKSRMFTGDSGKVNALF